MNESRLTLTFPNSDQGITITEPPGCTKQNFGILTAYTLNDPPPDPSPVASYLASLEGEWQFHFQRSDDGTIALCVGYADEPCLVAHYLTSDDVRHFHAQLTAILFEEDEKDASCSST